jgi:hypothetical protein
LILLVTKDVKNMHEDYRRVGQLRNDRGGTVDVLWSPTFKRVWVSNTEIGVAGSENQALDVALNWWSWNKDKMPWRAL